MFRTAELWEVGNRRDSTRRRMLSTAFLWEREREEKEDREKKGRVWSSELKEKDKKIRLFPFQKLLLSRSSLKFFVQRDAGQKMLKRLLPCLGWGRGQEQNHLY